MDIELIQIDRRTLEAMLSGLLDEKLKDIRAAVLTLPDTTPLPDNEVAARMKLSVSTVRRYKKQGRLKSVRTARGLMVRECDLEAYYKPQGSSALSP